MAVDPEFIQECATGVEDCASIARRYGYTDDEWAQLERDEWFNLEVERAIAERKKAGKVFTTKAAVMSEQLLENLFRESMKANIPVKDKATVLAILAKLGNLEPAKTQQEGPSGPGFSITIKVPEMKSEVVVEKVEEKKPDVEDIVVDIPLKESSGGEQLQIAEAEVLK